MIKPHDEVPAIRLVMMPKDVNQQGSVFGGVILSLMDQAAFVEAVRQADRKYATVALDEVSISKPVSAGDILSVLAQTLRVGRTSITISVKVISRKWGSTPVSKGIITLVAISDEGKPTPIFDG